MKRFVTAVLVLVLAVCMLTACGSKNAAVYKDLKGYETITCNEDGSFIMNYDDGKTSFKYEGHFGVSERGVLFKGTGSANANIGLNFLYEISEEGYLLDRTGATSIQAYEHNEEQTYILAYSEQLNLSSIYIFTVEDGINVVSYGNSASIETTGLHKSTYTVDGNVYHIDDADVYIYIPADGSEPALSFVVPDSTTRVTDFLSNK